MYGFWLLNSANNPLAVNPAEKNTLQQMLEVLQRQLSPDKFPALIGPWYGTEKFQTSFIWRKWKVTFLHEDDTNMKEN